MALFGKRRTYDKPDWWNQLFVGDPNAPEAGRPPMGDGMYKPRSNFLGADNWGDRLGNLASSLGAAGAYMDGDWASGAAISGARNSARDAALAAERKRQQDREDYQWRMQAEAEFKAAHPDPVNPYRFEDNAGNVWERNPQTGENTRIFTDQAPKQIYDPANGRVVTIPNPYTQGAGQDMGGLPHVSSEEDVRRLPPGSQFIAPDGSVRTVPGGGSGNAAGGFPRYRR
jgi:hypothetical protein